VLDAASEQLLGNRLSGVAPWRPSRQAGTPYPAHSPRPLRERHHRHDAHNPGPAWTSLKYLDPVGAQLLGEVPPVLDSAGPS